NLKCFYEFWIISFGIQMQMHLNSLEKGKNTLHQVETSIFCPSKSFVLLVGFSRGCKQYSKLILDLVRTARTITVSSSSFRYIEGTVVHLPHELLRSWIYVTIDFFRTSRAGQTKVQTYGPHLYEPYKSLEVMWAHSEQSMHQSYAIYGQALKPYGPCWGVFVMTTTNAVIKFSSFFSKSKKETYTVIKCNVHIPSDLSGYDRIPLTST
ncbi:unnamed protein product, partial [Musa acuminata var. zebrina]